MWKKISWTYYDTTMCMLLGKQSICDFLFGEHEDLAAFYLFPFDKDSGFGCMAYKDSILTLSIVQVWFGLCLLAKC